MCGLVGFLDPGGHTADPNAVLQSMSAAVAHRGPDDEGDLVAPPLWLGHRRLAIVDTGLSGRQPFVERDASGAPEIVAAANAEIYNHPSLRKRIREVWPDDQISASDCAVLPRLWRLDRHAVPEQLQGMFALAIWDAKTQELLLARDRAGQKPLYYASLPGGGIAFGSEPRALLAHPLVSRELAPVGLRRYLAFDYTFGQGTIYRHIHRLEPGHRLRWTPTSLEVESYWEFPTDPLMDIPEAEAEELLWRALCDSVQARLMSDVPLGVFLSGGVDSAAIVSALSQVTDPSGVETFSIGFSEPSFDESGAARDVAEEFGTRHHQKILGPEDLVAVTPEILGALDTPMADPSIVPTTLLSRFARERVKVVLGGDGGDELLMGYPTFFAERVARWAAGLPRVMRRGMVEPVARMLPVSDRYMSLDFKVRRFLSGLDHPAHHRHLIWVGGVHPSVHEEALAPRWYQGSSDAQMFSDADELSARIGDRRPGDSPLERLAWQYFSTYLPEDVLTKVDRASMASGLEVRAPFLDERVIRVCAGLHQRFKIRGGVSKRILRRLVVKAGVPAAVAARPKQGFAMPVARWLRGPLLPWVREVLASSDVKAGGLLNPTWVQKTLDEHVAGRQNHAKALWSALVLELWRRGPHGPGDIGG